MAASRSYSPRRWRRPRPRLPRRGSPSCWATSLPDPATIPDASFALMARARELVEAVVMTDVDEDALAAAADDLAAITERLRARRRDQALFLVRHPDGRVESMVQAGSGRLNPQAPPVEWIERPTEPPAGSVPRSVEVRARCTFTAAHSGSPSRVHGGVVAAVLDETIGVAATAAGASGMTVALNVSLKAGTPFDRPVEIVRAVHGQRGPQALRVRRDARRRRRHRGGDLDLRERAARLMDGHDVNTGAAWRSFCERIAAVGDRILGDDFPADPRDRAEGVRHLANQVACWLTYAVGHTDPAHPAFFRSSDPVYQWGGPNVDQVARRAAICGRRHVPRLRAAWARARSSCCRSSWARRRAAAPRSRPRCTRPNSASVPATTSRSC